jgi:hypothetical protein
MGRKKSPNSVSNYFNESVEEAIQLYNNSKTEAEKNQYFRIIYPAISKIAEVFYNKVKPEYIDGEPLDIQMDCICFLSERLNKIKPGKGKGFSYFTVCARNYYIYHNMEGYKEVKKTLKLDNLNENWDIADESEQRLEEMENAAKLLKAFTNYLEQHKDFIFKTKKYKKFENAINAVINLLNSVDTIEDFNRRKIMNDLTNSNGIIVDRHYVTKIFNYITMHYIAFRKEWDKTGKVIPFITKEELTDDELDYCIKHFSLSTKEYGIIALARKFSVPEYSVRKALAKEGLCTI